MALDAGQITNDATEERLRFVEGQVEQEIHRKPPKKKAYVQTRSQKRQNLASQRLEDSLDAWLKEQLKESFQD